MLFYVSIVLTNLVLFREWDKQKLHSTPDLYLPDQQDGCYIWSSIYLPSGASYFTSILMGFELLVFTFLYCILWTVFCLLWFFLFSHMDGGDSFFSTLNVLWNVSLDFPLQLIFNCILLLTITFFFKYIDQYVIVGKSIYLKRV